MKLTKIQQEVIEAMEQGWELRSIPPAGRNDVLEVWMQKKDRRIRIASRTLWALKRKKIIKGIEVTGHQQIYKLNKI